jgi:hypothetical protein
MFTKIFKTLFRILLLLILIASIFIHLKLPNYNKSLESETANLKNHLSMLINQKKYETILKQSSYGDYTEIKDALLPQIESEKNSMIEQYKNLLKENRLLLGHLDILTTKVIFDTKINRLKLIKNGKVSSDFIVPKKLVQEFLKSEITKKILKILAKEKNPTPIKPEWTYEDITKEIPAANSPERMMTGALGKYAIFLNDYLIIHDIPKNMEFHDTINHVCIQLKTNEIRKLYNSVYVGTLLYVE